MYTIYIRPLIEYACEEKNLKSQNNIDYEQKLQNNLRLWASRNDLCRIFWGKMWFHMKYTVYSGRKSELTNNYSHGPLSVSYI